MNLDLDMSIAGFKNLMYFFFFF